ncbi:methyl-accepting chemotaxis protein [Serratia sp. SSNIH2]|uniref:Chemotaxis protein n=2 Tax=Serratia TaxID=613 RepID=A0A2F0PGE3_SERMA|nr:methyl-accepting chemotaxis protein [Serratia sp. SSNIH1]OCO77420.1 chemotaxis protein [Serratia marcescens]POU50325.1 methyl-accepting chemotaxis protein [Serratia sp. SSNIH4]POW33865.1 methyl-accepting chemotaxis protein [Serratia sp. SSNIH5]POW41702.1 methyl-accepting chemotaxis protein [Serratia sp. SSNIH2]POW63168.1 methyl-accepting chemotaxis protein [Serratia sp. SSNIH3]
MNIKLTLGRRVKSAAALPRAFGFGKSMGLLSGVICVIALFSLLQLFSTVFISNILRDAKANLVAGNGLHRQQATMDRARLSLLTASDSLNRAGIYYLQDKATGSDGSWHSLLDESLAALQASEQAFVQFERLSAEAPEAAGALKDSYRLFYDGLKEQAQGLQGSSIDAFFAVPIQAFQADFNEKYLAYQALKERRGDDVNVRQLAALEQARTFALGALAALALIAVGVWVGVSRWVIAPLRRAIAHLNVLAAGDLSRPLPPERAFNREMRQLQTSIGHMQGGLQRLVSEVRDAASGILNGVGRLADGNRQLTAQSAKQNGELQLATEQVQQLAARVEENGQYAQQASQRTEQARQCAGAGEQMMQTVNVSMQGIVNQSAKMRGIVALIDSVAFQTNILALNAAIEAAHAGVHGRGFAIVAKEVGLLAQKSSHSTRDIQQLINRSLQQIDQGSQAVELLTGNLRQIIDLVNKCSALMGDISLASLNQGESIQDVTARISALNQVVRQTGTVVNAVTEASQLLQGESERLEKAMARFRLPAQ